MENRLGHWNGDMPRYLLWNEKARRIRGSRKCRRRSESTLVHDTTHYDAHTPRDTVEVPPAKQRGTPRRNSQTRTTNPCRDAYPNLTQDFQALLARLDRGPVSARVRSRTGETVSVTMTKDDFAYAVRGILYSENGVAEMPTLIHGAASSGDFSELAQRDWVRAVTLGRSIARGVHLSAFCAEDVAYVTDADVEAASAGTFMGRYLIDEYRRACSLWPRAPIAADFRTPLTARVPVLLLSCRCDPVTPPEFAVRVARSLPLVRHVVAPGGAHGVAGDCPRPAVLHVLMQGTLEGMPVVCR